jgi:hypothetical protein
MERSTFFYAFWSLLVAGLFTSATYYGYSPFADGGRGVPGARAYGPTHK